MDTATRFTGLVADLHKGGNMSNQGNFTAVLERWIEKTVNLLTLFSCLLMVLLAATVIFEIISRYVFNLPITFTEELTSLMFPWIVFLAAVDVTKRDEHIAITVLTEKLPQGAKKINLLFIKAVMLIFSLCMVKSSYILCQETVSITLPVLRFLTKAHLYASITFSFSFISLIIVLQIIRLISAKFGSHKESRAL